MGAFLFAVTRNLASLLGVAITSSCAVIILTLFALELVGFAGNPYLGILTYLILPAIFFVGLLLIPAGLLRERRRARRAAERGEAPRGLPVIDLNLGRTRRVVLVFLMLTLVNVIILATATYKGVEIMDSPGFCGATCHVMLPEKTVYEKSPHARVPCVACHIGPGADWFVKAKVSGAWQVVSTNLSLYPRPIPTPIHDLRPARETCEQCHWPAKFVGDRLRVITRHADDEANTELKTVLLLKVGGVDGRRSRGIHWHVDPAVRIRYRADEKRETIHEVELTKAEGTTKTYRNPGAPAHDAGGPWREMDCVDCHNRPAHIYRMPEDEVDAALASRALDPSLPHLRRESLRLLNSAHPSHEAARRALAEGIDRFYRESYPALHDSRKKEIEAAGRLLGELYCGNVFPTMNVTWGTYPNHIGHRDSPGCFRCHGGEHATPDGEVISPDCATCHTLLAMEEEQPPILGMLQP